MYRTSGVVAALQNRNHCFRARARKPGINPLLNSRSDFRRHLPELYEAGSGDVTILNDDDSDEELVITGSRQAPKRPIQKPRKVVHVNKVQRVVEGPLRLMPGCDVELVDQSFIRIVEYLPDTTHGPCIKGYRLLQQNHCELLMPEREHELVQLVKIDDDLNIQYSMSTVRLAEVARNCTIVFTSQQYRELNYRKGILQYTEDGDDLPIYFCRYTSADVNVGTEEGDPTGPPLAGRIEHLHPGQADNGALILPNGRQIEFQISDQEVRKQWRRMEELQKRYTFGDAFCGAGGTSSGAFSAGLRLKFAVDFDPTAIETYRTNFGFSGTRVMLDDVTNFINFASMPGNCYVVDFLHMSPPCQPFCGANRTPNEEDNRRNINAFSKVASLLEVCKPRIVTLEEAKSLTDIDKRKHFRDLISSFIRKGYSVQWKAVELSKFGVPQTRSRTIIIASGPGEQLPAFIQPTHGDGPGLEPIPTIKSTINAIPADAPHQSNIPDMRAPKVPYKGEGLCQTIMTAVKNHHYHPSGHRRFSICEYARLQTFPTYFLFSGSTAQMLKQIGNAVPPLFAETLYRHLKAALRAADEAEKRELRGPES